MEDGRKHTSRIRLDREPSQNQSSVPVPEVNLSLGQGRTRTLKFTSAGRESSSVGDDHRPQEQKIRVHFLTVATCSIVRRRQGHKHQQAVDRKSVV